MTQDTQILLQKAQEKIAGGQFGEALVLAQQARDLDPGNPNSYRLLGQLHRALKNYPEALESFELLLGHFPKDGELKAEVALTLYESGQEDEGFEEARAAQELEPDSPFTLEVAANIAKARGALPLAIENYEKLVEKFPGVIRFHGFIAECYGLLQRHEDAARAFENFIKIQGENAGNCYQMAMFLFLARLFEEAVPWFEKAAGFDPKNDEPVFYLARCHIQFGDLEKGKELALKTLALNPGSIHALTLLNELDPKLLTDDNIQTVFKKLEEGGFEEALERAMAHLFLGKFYHKAKEYDKAFAQFSAANDERYQAFSEENTIYDKALMEGNYGEVKKIFTRDRMKKMAGNGSNSEVPILIAAMPRSGTTLLEQIIASHSNVYGGGESTGMGRIFIDLNIKINADLEKPIEDIIRENAAEWAEIYLNELRAPKGVLRATDKMPINFIHLGIFQAMFPKGRVIYIRRHPLDNCMSMFSNNLSQGYAYTARLDTLGHYFNLHADLMCHWRENLDMKYLEVDYPDLVAEPEKKAREILEFCGLPWEDQVLEFYKGRKSAYTISQVQVSEPINKKGLGRWVPYKKHIGELIAALDEDIVGPLGVDEV